MSKSRERMNEDRAATMALQALGFLAGRQEVFDRFAQLGGLDPASIRARASDPHFLAAVLDFLLTDEGLLVEFCDDGSIEARDVHMARYVLGGP